MTAHGPTRQPSRRAGSATTVALAAIGLIALLSLSGVVLVGSGPSDADALPIPDEVTWATDIGPIIARECLDCHGEDPYAPFTLLTYADAAERADRIARATSTRRMPPWLPRGEHGTFAGERILSDRVPGVEEIVAT